jgi:putative Mg2+ transporter-C (MgtC) family protein
MHGFAVIIPAGSFGDFTGRAIVALVLGAVIGLERQWRQRMAGLRTNALVALGAALFELFAVLLTGQHGVDPTRIAAYVVSGVGFLGAGVILRDGVNIRGINTAATIWCSAAVGVLARGGLHLRGGDRRSPRGAGASIAAAGGAAVRSEDLDSGGGRVEVVAELQRYGCDDVALETAVSRLSLEPSVSSVSWNVIEPAAMLADEE